MPRVPVLDTYSADQAATPQARLQASNMPDVAGAQLQAAGKAGMSAGTAVASIAADMQDRENKLLVSAELNEIVRADTDLRVEATALRGRNALERPDGKALPDEYVERLNKRVEESAAKLKNPAQRQLLTEASRDVANRLRVALSGHVMRERETFEADTAKSTIEAAQQRAVLLHGDSQEFTASLGAIDATVDGLAKARGWDDKTRESARLEAKSPVHLGVMKTMLSAGNASGARAYYEANSAQMTTQMRAQMLPVLKQANDAQTGDGAAEAVWTELGPKGVNDPVRQADMEKQVRERLRDNPDAMKLAIDGLRQRSQAHNAQQTEVNAGNVNAVFALLDGKTPLGRVMQSPEWLALPAAEQRKIRLAMEQEAYTQEQRAAARASRAASEEARLAARDQRAFTAMQREDTLLRLNKPDAYMTYSDPAVLAGMSRQQVMALRPEFGIEGTTHLLNRWDSLQKAEGKMKAQIDQDVFFQVAREMGLDPDKKKPGPEEKARLGTLKYRIEALIDYAQQTKKSPLTREETEQLVRGEMARTVTVDGTWMQFGRDSEVPVISLSPEQLSRVIVPAGERPKIAAALQEMYRQDPSNPLYAPTDANVRRLYVMGRSRAGALVDGK